MLDRCEVAASLFPRNRHKTLHPIAMADDICDRFQRFVESSLVPLLARLSCVDVLTVLIVYRDGTSGILSLSTNRKRTRSTLKKAIRQPIFAPPPLPTIS